MTEQSALLGLMTDGTKNAAVCPGGPDGNSAGRGEPGDRSGPVGSRSGTDRPVLKDRGRNAPNCPVGHDVMLAGRRPSGPTQWNGTVCLPQIRCRPGGAIPTNRVHPGAKMFHSQPVADGPAGPDRTRRPVGNDEMYAVHDEVRPTAGGPVGRFPDSGPLKYSKMSFPQTIRISR